MFPTFNIRIIYIKKMLHIFSVKKATIQIMDYSSNNKFV